MTTLYHQILQSLHSDRLLKFSFVDHSKMHTHKSKMSDCQQLFDRFWYLYALWRLSTLICASRGLHWYCFLFRRWNAPKAPFIKTTVLIITTKLCSVMKTWSTVLFVGHSKVYHTNPSCGWPPSWENMKNCYILATVWLILLMKFCKVT